MQSIKKILVPVDGSTLSLSRLESGMHLANALGAAVTALCVMPVPQPSLFSAGMHAGWFMGEEMLAKVREQVRESAGQIRLSCDQVAERLKTRFDWQLVEEHFASTIRQAAKFHDLILIGKPDTLNEPQLNASGVDSALLFSGRPSIVLSGVAPVLKTLPRKIVFAWNGSRECLAALDDAAVFMAHAASVMVVTVLTDETQTAATESDVKSITDFLLAHEIAGSAHVIPCGKHQSTGDVLIDYAEESEADLIVMGAYGHSRFREIFLGGTTLDVLHRGSAPVLFSH